MKLTQLWHRTARVATAVGLLTSSLAGTASASHVRYKDSDVRVVRATPVYYNSRPHSSAGAILGGFVGGLVVGAMLGNATHAQAQYVYEDPYSGYDYPSYDAYLDQCRYVDRPRIVRVIEVRSGRCVRTCRYDRGRWVDTRWDDPYADQGGYGDQGYYGDRYDRGGNRDNCDSRWRDGCERTWQRERGDCNQYRDRNQYQYRDRDRDWDEDGDDD